MKSVPRSQAPLGNASMGSSASRMATRDSEGPTGKRSFLESVSKQSLGTRLLGFVVAALVIGSLASRSIDSDAAQTYADKQAAVSFQKDVLPYLKKHCFECHG